MNVANAEAFRLFPVEDGALLSHPAASRLWILNSSALFIWNRMLAGLATHDMALELAGSYLITADTALRDTNAALSQFDAILATNHSRDYMPESETLSGFTNAVISSQIYSINGKTLRLTIRGEALQELLLRFEPHRSRDDVIEETEFEISQAGAMAVITMNGKVVCAEPVQSATLTLTKLIAEYCTGTREWLACMHAGAVVAGNACVLLAGPSRSGKSTLIARLLKDGYKLISDDLTGIEPAYGAISGLPLAIKVREGSWSVLNTSCDGLAEKLPCFTQGALSKFWFPPQGGEYRSAPARLIAFVRYSHDEEDTLVRRLTTLEALQFMDQAGFWLREDEEAIRFFLEWMANTPSYELVSSDLDSACSALGCIPAGE
jgi:hypothetical protein